MMKKYVCILMFLCTMISFCACGVDEQPDNEVTTSQVSQTQSEKSKTEKKIYSGYDAYTYEEVEGGIAITQFKNYDYEEYDQIIIPSEIDGKTVVGIGVKGKYYNRVFGAVFGSCEIVIPQSVEYIDYGAFQDADGLVKLSGGEKCKEIGEFAFLNCINLVEITFIETVETIADNAFDGCTNWQSNLS